MTNKEIRSVFGRNLRELVDRHHKGNVSAACRHIGINRTQFNRYLMSDSWPRPDQLWQIIDKYPEADARMLVEPLAEFDPRSIAEKLAVEYMRDEIPMTDMHSWRCAIRSAATRLNCYNEFCEATEDFAAGLAAQAVRI